MEFSLVFFGVIVLIGLFVMMIYNRLVGGAAYFSMKAIWNLQMLSKKADIPSSGGRIVVRKW